MAEQPALKPFVVREHAVINDMSTDDHLEVARQFAQTIYHPTSTCRMGTDNRAVVDPRLKVYRLICGLLMRLSCRQSYPAIPMPRRL